MFLLGTTQASLQLANGVTLFQLLQQAVRLRTDTNDDPAVLYLERLSNALGLTKFIVLSINNSFPSVDFLILADGVLAAVSVLFDMEFPPFGDHTARIAHNIRLRIPSSQYEYTLILATVTNIMITGVTSRSIFTNSGPILTQLRFRLQQSRINLDRTPVLVRTFALLQFHSILHPLDLTPVVGNPVTLGLCGVTGWTPSPSSDFSSLSGVLRPRVPVILTPVVLIRDSSQPRIRHLTTGQTGKWTHYFADGQEINYLPAGRIWWMTREASHLNSASQGNIFHKQYIRAGTIIIILVGTGKSNTPTLELIQNITVSISMQAVNIIPTITLVMGTSNEGHPQGIDDARPKFTALREAVTIRPVSTQANAPQILSQVIDIARMEDTFLCKVQSESHSGFKATNVETTEKIWSSNDMDEDKFRKFAQQ
ncbi:hypothetical protein FB45DRAFT_860195 [Roridomyces roridus]|uniref:Uncharacterized protein n=1 Tax=Roridomyces roridus TaxID=1738132 RepID=A0AAD7FW96_9AGAR|nr:hypothetical protein FB45DRAFT_860195 [Roridomyces roridus]